MDDATGTFAFFPQLRRGALTALLCAASGVALAAGADAAKAPAPKPVAAANAPLDLAADTTYLLPGTFNRTLSLDDLRKRYGAANVSVGELPGAEGETLRGIILFDTDPQRRAEIFPQDEATQRGIATIRVSGKSSRWHVDNGMHLGMTLAELVAANGKPVTFSGMGWDYGGGILDWHGGKFAQETKGVFRSVTLTQPDEAPENAFPLGDGEFSSDDKKYPLQGKLLYVGQISVSFNDE